MSNKNYGKYFKGETTPTTKEVTESVVTEEVVETVTVEPETDVEEVVEPTVEPAPVTAFGTVANCAKLNIRNNPHTQSEILCKVEAGAQLTIDLNKSTTEWYKVCTASGVDGYCMKKFVTLQ